MSVSVMLTNYVIGDIIQLMTFEVDRRSSTLEKQEFTETNRMFLGFIIPYQLKSSY